MLGIARNCTACEGCCKGWCGEPLIVGMEACLEYCNFPGPGLYLGAADCPTLPNRGFLSAISTQGDRIMRPKTIVVLTFLLFSISSGHAARHKVLYAFTAGLHGKTPYARVIINPPPNLSGVTEWSPLNATRTCFHPTPPPTTST